MSARVVREGCGWTRVVGDERVGDKPLERVGRMAASATDGNLTGRNREDYSRVMVSSRFSKARPTAV